MTDLANPTTVRRLEREAAMLERQKQGTIREIMSTASGRLWMLDRLDKCFSNPFSTNNAQMAFNCGELNASLKLLNEVMVACPDSYILMMNERNQRDAARQRLSDADTERASSGDDSANGRIPDHPNLVEYGPEPEAGGLN